MDIESITNSATAIGLLAAIARTIPVATGYRIADFAARQISRQHHSAVVRAVRRNQRQVLGGEVPGAALDRAVVETLRNSARSIFDLYHYLSNPRATARMIELEPEVEALIRRSEFEREGVILAGIHLSSFDLCLRWFCQQGIRPLVLTVPDPRGGRRAEYEMRRELGMNLVPATVAGLRHALKHLQNGGAVLTGIDRPAPRTRLRPRFFGQPAALPVHHIRLAEWAEVPIIVVAARREADGTYRIEAADAMRTVGGQGTDASTLRNAEKVLRSAEAFIRNAPHQWSMPLPVWPSDADRVL